MKTLRRSWLSLLVVTAASCGTLLGQTAQPSIEIQHRIGLGNGYGYTLTVFADGRVEYQGGELSDRSMFLPGNLSYSIPEQKARELVDRCSSDWFRSLKDHYFPGPGVIDVGDAPEVWLICNRAGSTKTVRDVSASPAPDTLHHFEQQVSSAAHPVANRQLMSEWIASHPNLKTPQGDMAVDMAAELNALPELEMLLKHGGSGNRPDTIEAAIRGGCEDCVAILQKAGASLSAPDSYGYTPLLVAAGDGNPLMVTRLLAAGADPNLPSPTWGSSKEAPPLMAAVTCPDAAPNGRGQLSLSAEITPEWKSLIQEKRQDCIGVVRTLIEHHANVNLADKEGETPLMLAVDADSPETVQLLLKAGATSKPRDQDGHTAIDRAKGNAEMLNLLQDRGPIESSPAPLP